MTSTSARALLFGVLALASGCGVPPERAIGESAAVATSARDEAWEAMCVDGEVSAASDSALALVAAAATVWSAERAAFRQYQSHFCEDCAMFEASAPEFFQSSSALVLRAARRFPESATAACAVGMMHYREASLGEGSFDKSRLSEALTAFQRATSLSPTARLDARLRVDIGDVGVLLERP